MADSANSQRLYQIDQHACYAELAFSFPVVAVTIANTQERMARLSWPG